MTSLSEPPRRYRLFWVLAVLAISLALALIGFALWQQFNPFFHHDQAVQESNELRDAARRGPLTESQFRRLRELSGPSRQPSVSQSVIATLELEARRSPDRLETAREILKELTNHPDPGVRSTASSVLSRLDQPSPAK